jgi:hypothetical protein
MTSYDSNMGYGYKAYFHIKNISKFDTSTPTSARVQGYLVSPRFLD